MVKAERSFLNIAFWMLVLCCVRMVIYMKMHPSIASITETFMAVGLQLVNFMLSFGAIFLFTAYIAHVRFGFLYDEFSTFRQSCITQYALLVGDSAPDYSKDPLMILYVVGFVFICSLSMLNFLLAIVVNGYTEVTERALENRVARSIARDLIQVPVDVIVWVIHRTRWPSKIDLLNGLMSEYPDVFAEEKELVVRMDRETFAEIVLRVKPAAAEEDADQIFDRYIGMRVLQLFPDEHQLDPRSAAVRREQVEQMRRSLSIDRQMRALAGSHQPGGGQPFMMRFGSMAKGVEQPPRSKSLLGVRGEKPIAGTRSRLSTISSTASSNGRDLMYSIDTPEASLVANNNGSLGVSAPAICGLDPSLISHHERD